MTDQPYSNRILELADKWIGGSITEPEKQELFAWYARFDDQELLLAPEYEPVIQALKHEMLAVIRQRIAADTSPPAEQEPRSQPMIQWLRVVAAAVLIGAIATGAIFFAGSKARVQAPIVAGQKQIPSPTDK